MWVSVWRHTQNMSSTPSSAWLTFRISPTFLILLSIRMRQSSPVTQQAADLTPWSLPTHYSEEGWHQFPVSVISYFLQDGVFFPMPKHQPGGPGLFCSGVLSSATVSRYLKALEARLSSLSLSYIVLPGSPVVEGWNMTCCRSPLLGACNSHNKPMQRHFYRPVYF